MSRTWWAWARPLGSAAILAVLVWRLGTGPLVDGLRLVNGWCLAAAAGIAVLTTVCCAWRWTLVARGLGVGVPLPTAIAAYYRSQFLNTTLPGGVLGDVHRGIGHGRDAGDMGRGLRAVAWERVAGQFVQIALTMIVLLLLPSPVRSSMPIVVAAVAAGALVAVLVSRVLPRGGPSRLARARRAAGADLRHGLLPRRVWPGIVLLSAVVVIGHATTFLIAARTAGSTASTDRLLPLALVVLAAMAVPANIAGWGPREGAAAWTFGVAGLGAAQGVAAAVVYGVMVIVSSLPGAVVLLVVWLRRHTPAAPERADPTPWRAAVAASTDGAARG